MYLCSEIRYIILILQMKDLKTKEAYKVIQAHINIKLK
jgi:hypothetical protein